MGGGLSVPVGGPGEPGGFQSVGDSDGVPNSPGLPRSGISSTEGVTT